MTADRAQKPPRVLVVDDDAQLREVIRWALEDEGFQVETAADGGQALERAAAGRPDLVVLDVTLPVVDGYGVAAGLRARYGEGTDRVAILAITGDGQAAAKAARVGAYEYVRKPFDVETLLEAVARGLR